MCLSCEGGGNADNSGLERRTIYSTQGQKTQLKVFSKEHKQIQKEQLTLKQERKLKWAFTKKPDNRENRHGSQ